MIGSAGCGKTTMALYRALLLNGSALDFGGDTAVITYNRSLSNWMTRVVEDHDDRPDVMTFHSWAKEVLSVNDGALDGYLSNAWEMKRLTKRGYMNVKGRMGSRRVFSRTPDFFTEELAWIDGMGIVSLSDYKNANRAGRGDTRLTAEDREGVWAVRDEYLRQRSAAGYRFDLRDIASEVLRTELSPKNLPYRHLVIDEGQDLKPQMLRALAKATPEGGSIAFFGDPTQQIYGNQMSWRSAGFSIQKQWVFTRNHRNTKQIARLAEAVGAATTNASLGDEPSREGPLPELVRFGCVGVETFEIAQRASVAAEKGTSVAVLARRQKVAAAVAKAASVSTRQLSRSTKQFESGVVYWGTVHSAKGFEFDEVFVVGLDDASWPDPIVVGQSDTIAATDQDAKLLYVAVTRARNSLTLSYAGTPTDLIADTDGFFQAA